jgi:hypothetical protein
MSLFVRLILHRLLMFLLSHWVHCWQQHIHGHLVHHIFFLGLILKYQLRTWCTRSCCLSLFSTTFVSSLSLQTVLSYVMVYIYWLPVVLYCINASCDSIQLVVFKYVLN